MIISLALTAVWLGLLPMAIGCMWMRKMPGDRGSLLASYLYGLVTIFAIYELLGVYMTLSGGSLTALTRYFMIAELVMTGLSVAICRSFRPQLIWILHLKGRLNLLILLVVAIMLLQAWYVMKFQHEDADDSFYVVSSVEADQTDTLYRYDPYTGEEYDSLPMRYVLSPWPFFLATFSRIARVHPTIFCHFYFPPILVVWAYMVCALFASMLFPDDTGKQGLFLLFVAVVLSFSGFSIYSSPVFLFTRGWQGKAVLSCFIIPGTTYTLWAFERSQSGDATSERSQLQKYVSFLQNRILCRSSSKTHKIDAPSQVVFSYKDHLRNPVGAKKYTEKYSNESYIDDMRHDVQENHARRTRGETLIPWIQVFLMCLSSCMFSAQAIALMLILVVGVSLSFAFVNKKRIILLYSFFSVTPCLVLAVVYYSLHYFG